MNKINPYPVTSDTEELKNDSKIIQKEHFKNNISNEELKVKKYGDKVDCMICGKRYTRYNKSKHNKTKHHIFCEKLNKKWRDSIIN